MNALLQPLEGVAGFDDIRWKLRKNEGILAVSGCLESQKVHMAAGLREGFPAALLAAQTEERAKEIFEDCRLYDRNVLYYPPRDLLFFQADIAGNILTRQRIRVIKALLEEESVTIVTGTLGLMDRLLPLRLIEKSIISLKAGDEMEIDQLAKQLAYLGYEREGQVVSPGQFSVRGGIVDLFCLTEDLPFRIEFWGDEVDSIRSFDAESQRSIENVEEISIYPAAEYFGDPEKIEGKLTDCFLDYMPKNSIIFLDEPERILEQAEGHAAEFRESMERRNKKGKIQGFYKERMVEPNELQYQLNRRNCVAFSVMDFHRGSWNIVEQYGVTVRSISPYNKQFTMLANDLKKWKKKGYQVVLLSASRTRGKRLAEDLRDEGLAAFFSEELERELQPGELLVTYGSVRKGFEYPMQKFVIITETDIFGKEQKKKKRKRHNYSGQNIQSFSELQVGDYVVHENYGLGIYKGIVKKKVDHISQDYIQIEYADDSNLYVLATKLDVLQKYAGGDAKQPKLTKLGTPEWKKTKARVKRAVEGIAKELVRLYALREKDQGFEFGPDTVWQKEFEEMFPFEETEDQLSAIEAVKKDMESPKIMDRLICGDVGYGKTEIAVRAAFKAVQENKQVVILAPTTILAQQHYNTFTQRMKDFPVRVDLLCRFRTPAQQKKTMEDLERGLVDILIGTHRVLSKDVHFKDLGLLVIDEEQRFGVTHKEKIKQMKSNVDVLTLTATPIPRTLHMSLTGIRDMSVLEEAPVDRVPIQTYVMEYDEELVREAIQRELKRGGQVFYVYNRVNNIVDIAAKIESLLPDANVEFAHGQMKEHELERIMCDFINGDIDVLVSTTIIETGMDISNVNTIIIHDADKMGLSQLYQLRGRVGRSSRTAYAFLMYRRDKLLKDEAEKRLHAIREFTELGSGVKIAMRDLELRGAGNILGAEQHGHMEAVGYDLYCKMLSLAVGEAKGEAPSELYVTTIDLTVDAFIPANYIKNESQKLDIYKRIAAIRSREESDDMLEELLDRFGDPPKSVQNLLSIAEIKAQAHKGYVTEIKQMGSDVKLTLYEKAQLDVARIPELLQKYERGLSFEKGAVPSLVYHMNYVKGKKRSVLESMQELTLDLMDLRLEDPVSVKKD